MKTAPIVAAQLERTSDGIPCAPAFGDIYHPRAGASEQARHVFLGGNGLPQRWARREDFVVLETGFGLGSNFLATWAAWRADPTRCTRLRYLAVEKHPPTRADLDTVMRDDDTAAAARELVAAWPALTHNLHRLVFEGGRVQLLLAFGDVAAWLPELVASVDAVYLDGFAPDRNPQMWQPRLFKAIARLATTGATAATWSAARAVRDGLAAAGFTVERQPGSGGKRDITTACYAPAATVRPAPPGRPRPRTADTHALIVGAGLAGCSTAWALAEQGWRCTLIDRHTEPATEASGNPAGLFHGIVNPQDGAHARWQRAAALEAERAVRRALAEDGVRGALDGLLRLDDGAGGIAAMHATLKRLGLPSDYVQALDAAEASVRAGLPLASPAWFYPGGGWVDPAGLARSYLRRAGAALQWRGGVEVARLRRAADRWQLLGADGQLIAEGASVVLASAGDALRLLGAPDWPIESVRGQLTIAPEAAWRAAGLPTPALPIAGGGYLLPTIDGELLFGATADAGDTEPAQRVADHERNLAQLTPWLGDTSRLDRTGLRGRTAWRSSSVDRLPVIGAVPVAQTASATVTQPRFVAREPGLFVYTGLGSRGITASALGAQVLAAWVSGAPMPVESSLLDAIDPARFVTRAVRRAAADRVREPSAPVPSD